MLTRFVIACFALSLPLACVKKEQAGPSPAPIAVETARPSPPPSAAEKRADPSSAGVGATVPALPAPLTTGVPIRITRLHKIKPLEIVVPEGVKLRMDFMDGGEIPPSAQLTGGSLNITVGPAEAGFSSLAGYTKDLAAGETVVHGVETPTGVLLVESYAIGSGRATFSVLVTRPALEVQCVQSHLRSLADAELAASVCLSLRAAK